MGFPKVEACCVGTAVIVRDAAFLLAVIIPSSAKKYIIRHPAMDFEITGSMWHRMVAVGIGWKQRLSS